MTALFSPDQWQRVQSVLEGLDQRQALWLSGYLAAPRDVSATPKTVTADSSVQVTIAYGSETGNSAAIAESLGRLLREQKIEPRLLPLAEVKLRTLARVQYLWIVCSTHGDGDPPEPAAPFFDGLLSGQAPELKHLKYAVLALGDSTYEHFCTAGLTLDRRLAELGAERLLPCVECDVDFKSAAGAWVDKVSGLVPRPSSAVAPITSISAPMPIAQAATAAPTRANPVELEVLENVCLTASDRHAAVHHVALLAEDCDLQLKPGDAVGVLPHNPPELVAAVLNVTGLSGEDAVVVEDQPLPLVQALREKLDLTIPGKPLLQLVIELTDDEELRQIHANSKTQREFLRARSVLEILRRRPVSLNASALVAALRPLQPRLYDIANTPGDDELHLTVQSYWYPHPNPHTNAQVAGIASRYLTQLQPGERVRLYPHHNKRFRLPDDKDVPLILVASSTGVAPYRAFVQSFAAEGRRHPCWLLLREQRFEEDFLYQTDWQGAAKNGVLTKMTTEFYEDQPSARLADALAEHLADWVGRGAHMYLCGDKEPLTELETALKENGELAEIWATLNAGKRLHRNLY